MDSHEREAAGAIAAMAEVYGRSLEVGDHVRGTTCGKTFSGEVLDVDGDRIVVEIDGGWLIVSRNDIEQDG